jgi:hypothetical protein
LKGLQAWIWFPAFAVPAIALAYQLSGGGDYVHAEGVEGLLGIDGLLLVLATFAPRANDSLFGRVRNRGGTDFEAVTLLLFLSALMMTNGLLDLKPSPDGVGLTAGTGIIPGKGVTTLFGIFFLLAAMVALFLLLADEFLSAGRGSTPSGPAPEGAATPRPRPETAMLACAVRFAREHSAMFLRSWQARFCSCSLEMA